MTTTPAAKVIRYCDMAPPAVVELEDGRCVEVYANEGRVILVLRGPQPGAPRAVALALTVSPDEARAVAAALVVAGEA